MIFPNIKKRSCKTQDLIEHWFRYIGKKPAFTKQKHRFLSEAYETISTPPDRYCYPRKGEGADKWLLGC